MYIIRVLIVLKILIWAGISSVLWSEISIYGDDITPQMKIFIMVIAILMHFYLMHLLIRFV